MANVTESLTNQLTHSSSSFWSFVGPASLITSWGWRLPSSIERNLLVDADRNSGPGEYIVDDTANLDIEHCTKETA